MTTDDALLESVYASRGRILQLTIQMETLIDIIISEYFFDNIDAQDEFSIVMLSKTGFRIKKEIFQYVLEKNTANDREDIKTVVTHVGRIIEDRNSFAHHPIDFSKEAIDRYNNEKIITYVKMRVVRENGNIHLGEKRLFAETNVNAILGLIEQVNKVLLAYIRVKPGDPLSSLTP